MRTHAAFEIMKKKKDQKKLAHAAEGIRGALRNAPAVLNKYRPVHSRPRNPADFGAPKIVRDRWGGEPAPALKPQTGVRPARRAGNRATGRVVSAAVARPCGWPGVSRARTETRRI